MISILFELKKKTPSLLRVEKTFLQNWEQRVSKEAEFWLISKMREEVPKDFFSEKTIFCKIFQVLKSSVFL
jgi:hypothetical protein